MTDDVILTGCTRRVRRALERIADKAASDVRRSVVDRCAPHPSRPALTVLDLFSGIGGFSLGLERTGGFRTVAFCEIEDYPRRVLAKHWPGVPIHRDVRELKAEHVRPVDIICGGFPCQDISTAGKGAGLAGERSGLWREYARLIGEIRPRYIIVENVAALLRRGIDSVLGDLAALGYDAEWDCIPGYYGRAPQPRDRIYIVAYPTGWLVPPRRSSGDFVESKGCVLSARWYPDYDLVEPDVPRVAGGVPARFHRISTLGNAVVPQIPEMIGRAILEAEAA